MEKKIQGLIGQWNVKELFSRGMGNCQENLSVVNVAIYKQSVRHFGGSVARRFNL